MPRGGVELETKNENLVVVGDEDAASVADSAKGDHLPDGYFYSPTFIGTWLVSK
jgi:hypothetical protein